MEGQCYGRSEGGREKMDFFYGGEAMGLYLCASQWLNQAYENSNAIAFHYDLSTSSSWVSLASIMPGPTFSTTK